MKNISWRQNSAHTPHLWQIAWDHDQVAGMVLARIDEKENQVLQRKRGYTEHVFIHTRPAASNANRWISQKRKTS